MESANCLKYNLRKRPLNSTQQALASKQDSSPKRARMRSKTVMIDEKPVTKTLSSSSVTSDYVEPGTKVFKVNNPLESGGFAKIFDVQENKVNSKKCALKVGDLNFIPKKNVISFSESDISDQSCSCKSLMLHDEATIHQNLKHDNIISFLSFGHITIGDEDNASYKKIPAILMELGEISLLEMIGKLAPFKLHLRGHTENPLPLERRCIIFSDVANGLKYMHNNSFIHMDLHPKNILISAGRAKICDFGLTEKYPLKQNCLNFSWSVALTYMAPEVFLTPSEVSTKSDNFTVGVMIKMCILGTTHSHSWYTDKKMLKNINYTPEYLKQPTSQEQVFNTFDVVTTEDIIQRSYDPEYKLADKKSVAVALLERVAKPCLEVAASKRPDIYQVSVLLDQIRDNYLKQK